MVTNCDHLARLKYSSSLLYAFTEHGALMLGNVLKSGQAVEMSLMVVRAFVRMRELIAGNKELAQKLAQLDRKIGAHGKAIAEIISALRQLMATEGPKTNEESFGGNLPSGYVGAKRKRSIGFAPREK